MTVKAKITLSDKELSLVLDPEFILTKRAIIDKVYDLFAIMTARLQTILADAGNLPNELRLSVPKISKGENYLQLPYVMLDYPRFFGKEDVFAVRTMFWWGNFFSITLIASGVFRKLIDTDEIWKDENLKEILFVNVNPDPWQHHFGADNVRICKSLSANEWETITSGNPYLKFALKYELSRWNEMPVLLEDGYRLIERLLVNFRGDGRVPSPGIPKAGSDL